MINTDSFAMIQLCCFWAGLLSLLQFTNLFVLNNELYKEQHVGLASSVFFSGDSFMGFYLVGYLRFIDKDISLVQQLIPYLTALSLILFHFLPESPKWLCSVGRFDEARESLRTIAKMNGASID